MNDPALERRRFLQLAAATTGAVVLRPSLAFGLEPAPSAIDNVLVMTSVRNGRLTLRVDYHLAAPEQSAAIAVQVIELDGTTAGLPSGSFPLVQRGPGLWRQEVVLPWANPRLWDVGAAYLYRAHVQIVRGLAPALTYPPIRFGFREVWRQGKHMMLNDHPLKLRQVPFIGSVPQMHFYGGMGMNAIEFQPNQGAWGQYPPLPFPGGPGNLGSLEMFDFADENGWIIMMPTVSVSLYKSLVETGDPTQAEVWLAMVRAANKEWEKQNRPSIISWVPVMNEVSNQDNPRHTNDPEFIGRELSPAQTPVWVKETMRLLKQEDPTRLVVFHEAGSSSDVHFGNVYLNVVPLQEREDHLSKWALDGTLPYGSGEFGPPTTAPMFKYRFEQTVTSDGIPYFTEFFAEYFGDGAYAAESDVFVNDVLAAKNNSAAANRAWGENFQEVGGIDRLGESTAYFAYVDLFIRNTNKSWRAWGANAGWHPWIQDIGFGRDPGWRHKNNRWIGNNHDRLTGGAELAERPPWANPIYDAYRETLQPLLVFLGGPDDHFTAKDHHYASGEVAQRTIVAVWDGPGPSTVNARWKLMRGTTQVATGTESFTLAPGTVQRRPISFTVPTTTSSNIEATLILEATVAATGATITDTATLTVFPPASAASLVSTWAIYDPVGTTTAELARLGFSAPSVSLGADLSDIDVLIVGTKVLDDALQLPATATDVENGLRILIFEQTAGALQAMGLRTEDVMPRYTFPRVGDHPALTGLAQANLVNWRGAGQLAPDKKANSWPYPDKRLHWGNRGSVASVVIETPHQGAFTPIVESCFDLGFSPLLEWEHGAGDVVFCQMDVTGRIGLDPAADRLVVNLIDYLDGDSTGFTGPAATRLPRAALVHRRRRDQRTVSRRPTADIAFIGSDADDQVLLHDVGFTTRVVDPANLTLQDSEVVVIGRGAIVGLSSGARQTLTAHVQNGGTALFLPRAAAELSTTAWPWAVGTEHETLARVAGPGSHALTVGIGPQLLRWRSFLDLDVITAGGLPTGFDRLLDGLLGRVPDGAGQWVVAQLDWRSLDAGGNNTRRPRWNARKLYRQLLTNLGATSRASVAEALLPAQGRSPLTVLGPWRGIKGEQVGGAPTPGSGGYNFNVYPGVERAFHQAAWPGASGPSWGQLIQPDNDGYVDLAPTGGTVSPRGPAAGQTAYARTYVHSAAARTATFSFGPAYWGILKVNGDVIADDSIDGNTTPTAGLQKPNRFGAELRAGWNRIEVAVCTVLVPQSFGYSPPHRLGFIIHTEDPGDLVVDAADTEPTAPPANPGSTQHSTAPIDLYIEPRPIPEDPYRFNVY